MSCLPEWEVRRMAREEQEIAEMVPTYRENAKCQAKLTSEVRKDQPQVQNEGKESERKVICSTGARFYR